MASLFDCGLFILQDDAVLAQILNNQVMSIESGKYFKVRVSWREHFVLLAAVFIVLTVYCLCLAHFLGHLLLSVLIIGLLVMVAVPCFTAMSFSFRLCPQGITWGGSIQVKYLIRWEEILVVKPSKGYKSRQALVLKVKARKFAPQHDRLLILPIDQMDVFIGAVMTHAPQDNPLRTYVQVHYLDPNTTLLTSD